MKDIISINLETQTAPKVVEHAGRNYIEYGTDEWNNLYPQFLIDLYYNSSTHAAIINATSEMISGEDIIIDSEEQDLETYVELKKFLANANGNETLHEVIKKVSFDFKLQGGFAMNLIWNAERTAISEIHHVPVERIRIGKPNELGKVDTYYISSDWTDIRKNKPQEVPAFNMNDRTAPSQILYTGLYSPSMELYYTPDYVSCCNWALVDQKVAEFHLSNICNGFSGSYFISLNNGVPTQEERIEIENNIARKFTGASASGKFVLTFSDDKNREPTITPIAVSNADKQYVALQELLVQNIMIGHRITSPMLLGVKTEGQLGGRDELLQAFELYQNTVIKPYQEQILKTLKKILTINDINLPISFVQASPITSKFSIEDMKAVMTQDEIRKELGLEPLENDEQVGLSSQKTDLENWIEQYGEDIPEDWELIDEQDAEGEHADFDYEGELNKLCEVKLASTGTARPNAKSEQDGVNKSYSKYYRVRYYYNEDTSLSRKSGQSRDFCEAMIRANKVFRKEDIKMMDSESVNPGWGSGKGVSYSIWLFKGGGNCHHRWYRRIFRTNVGRGVKRDIDDSMIITTTQARSEGFKPEANEQQVPVAPKQMPKNGFVDKKGY